MAFYTKDKDNLNYAWTDADGKRSGSATINIDAYGNVDGNSTDTEGMNGLSISSGTGASTGFFAGGMHDTYNNSIDRFNFASDYAVAWEKSFIYGGMRYHAGASSGTKGYIIGGMSGNGFGSYSTFPFSNGTILTQTPVSYSPTINVSWYRLYGMGFQDHSHAFAFGGYNSNLSPTPTVPTDTMVKISFASGFDYRVDPVPMFPSVGSSSRRSAAAISSQAYAHVAGGATASVPTMPTTTGLDHIASFAFANEHYHQQTGYLAQERHSCAGVSSAYAGYVVGGQRGTTAKSTIERFPFAAGHTIVTYIGGLTTAMGNIMGVSGETHGYTAGGLHSPTSTRPTTIERFSYSNDQSMTATDIGDIHKYRHNGSGHQV